MSLKSLRVTKDEDGLKPGRGWRGLRGTALKTGRALGRLWGRKPVTAEASAWGRTAPLVWQLRSSSIGGLRLRNSGENRDGASCTISAPFL